MACIAEHYRTAVIAAAEALSGAVDWLTPSLGKPLAIAVVAAAMLPPGWIMFQVGRVLVPDFVKWWYDETIRQKAREYWRRKCVGTGMTIAGAKISIACGVVFFFLIQLVLGLPAYYSFSLPGFLAAFAGVAVVGFFVGGNVPESRSGRNRYFRRFQAPTLTGVGLGAASSALQFVLQVGIAALSYA